MKMSELAKILRLDRSVFAKACFKKLTKGGYYPGVKIIRKEHHTFVYAKGDKWISFNPCSIEDRLTIIKEHDLPFNAHEKMNMYNRVTKTEERRERREKNEDSKPTI